MTGVAATIPITGCSTDRKTAMVTPLKIIDCHTHFYDPTRPQGVPWPNKSDTFLYRKILPATYRAEKTPTPVAGTVVVEASPWREDNQWVLDLAAKDPFIVGFCGNLDPAGETFAEDLKRFSANPLYRGIRVSGGSFTAGMRDGQFFKRLSLLADHDLQLDLNVGVSDLPDVARLAVELPSLRIVIDHLANTAIDGKTPDPSWLRGMKTVARHENVFAKVSGFVEGAGRVKKPSPVDPDFYVPWFDAIWNEFGARRLVYGSNWPVSALFAPLFDVQRLVEEYFKSKPAGTMARVFAENAAVAYRWVAR